MKRILGIVSVASFLLSGMPVLAQEANPTAQTRVSGWITQCASPGREADLNCNLEQSIFLTQNNQQLAKITLGVSGGTRVPEVLIQLPHGLYLPNGVDIQFDEETATKYNLHTCDANGCYILIEDVESAIKAMKKWKEINLNFQNLARNDIKITMPLDGFSKAFKAIQ
jgi:invasion protein IalB